MIRALVVAVLLSASLANAQERVVVYTATYLAPITGAYLADELYVLDGGEAGLKALRFTPSGSAEQMKAQALSILQSAEGEAVMASLKRAGVGMVSAWQHGIEKLPAVLVGDQVVYGVSDVVVALTYIDRRGSP